MSFLAKIPAVGHVKSRRLITLSRHIFIRVAFPVGIVFLSCFLLLDRLVQNEMREHIKQELVTRDTQTHRSRTSVEEYVRRSVGALAESSGLSAELGRRTPLTGAQAAKRLETLGTLLDDDIYALAGLDKTVIAAIKKTGKETQPIAARIPVASDQQLAEVNGDYFLFASYPIHRNGQQVGWLTTGRHWLRELPLDGANWYLLAKDHKVLQATGSSSAPAVKAGIALPECAGQVAGCGMDIGGQEFLLLRSAATRNTGNVEIYLVQSLDVLASPLLGMMRSLMLAGAFLSIAGALGLTLLTGRAITKPLQDITRSCARAQDSGQLFNIEVPHSRIAEVNALAQTLQGAMRSTELSQRNLTQAYFQFMGAIVALLDARDAYTAGHSHRVSAYSEALARDFGLPQEQIDDIRIGALLHDIGKIGVPDEVLRKHERLTKEEFDLMKQHPTIGRKVLEQVVQFEKYLDAVELHHENLDGTGYPRGLKGEQIPIAARIVKVADVYDALSTDRPYRKGMAPDEVHDILRKGSGSHFDRLLVEIFLNRSVPSFEHRSGLEPLQRALNAPISAGTAHKAIGA